MNLPERFGRISRFDVQTDRLKMRVCSCGDEQAIPIIFIHGNFSSSAYFENLMQALPEGYRALAVDLRGYGDTEDKIIDARRGAGDWSDDLFSLLQTMEISAAHWVGWSAGAAAIMQLAKDHPACTLSLTLVAPVSPWGFGGSRDVEGNACYPDHAGSGGGLVSPDFVRRIEMKDLSGDDPLSPRNVIQGAYFYKPVSTTLLDFMLEASLKQKTGAQRYPGDCEESVHWPHVAPGQYGPMNAVSARYLRLEGLLDVEPKPPVLWVRGNKDIVIDNQSLSDLAVLGKLNYVPGWPGEEVCPPQPMLDQTRAFFQQYQNRGGSIQEVVMQDVGHSPFIEKQSEFLSTLLPFLERCHS